MTNETHFLSDSAIKKEEQDLFNFNHYAKKVQKLIQLNSNNTEPFTIGIYGKWGEGKTSFLNLIEEKIENFDKKEGGKEYYKFHFNPWRYSKEEEMLFDFFDSLSKLFYVEKTGKLQKAGKWIKRYSKYLKAIKISSTVGIPKFLNAKVEFEPNEIFKALGEDLEGEEITIEKLKEKVNEAINEANFKVVVFIDDIDRLDKDEIYTILKLIKLNADFNNFVFIVALDYKHVCKAIKDRFGKAIKDGELFLEKIINIPIHLPKIEDSYLNKFFDYKLIDVFKNLQLNETEEQFRLIRNSFFEMNFSSPREIIRILNGFFVGAFTLSSEIILEDLFWIEWIKVKHKKAYNDLKSISTEFSHIPVEKAFENNFTTVFRFQISEVIKNHDYLKSKLDYLFITERKINSTISIRNEHSFERYFSYHIADRTPQYLINEILMNSDGQKLDRLNSLLVELLKRKDGFYKLLELIKQIKNQQEIRNNLYLTIVKNLSLIPISDEETYGYSNRVRVVELIANILYSDDNSIEISLKIAKELDVYELCYFTKRFVDKSDDIRKNLEKKIVEKAKNKFNINHPIYFNPSNPIKMIMHYWAKQDRESFNNHIKKSLTNIDRVKKLIRNFPTYWNNSQYGGLTQNNYEYMKTIIDVDDLYSRIIKYSPDLVSLEFPSLYSIDEVDETNEDDNLKQFVYWYKKGNNDI